MTHRYPAPPAAKAAPAPFRLSARTRARFAAALALAASATTLWADGRVSGRVTDAATRSATVGAEVVIEGTDLRTTTSRGGEFSFRSVPAGEQTIIVTYIGAQPTRQSITVVDEQTATVEIALGGEDVVMLEPFEVTGVIEGQARALNQQKASQNIVNIISSDSFGDYPDRSIADAARRLPGITVERGQGQGQGRYVSIRGMNADFNAVSINGVRVTVSNFDNASRSVPLDVISTKSAESIEVSKALRPDEDADSIGGSINIRTRSAFDRTGRSASAEAALNYSRMASRYGSGYYLDDTGYEVAASFSDFIDADRKWAVSVTANDSSTPYASQSVDARGWGTVFNTGPGPGAFNGFLAPTGVLLQEFFEQADSTGVTLGLEYRPTEDDQIRINTNYTLRDSRRGRQQQEIRYDLDQRFWVGPPAVAQGNTITEFTSDNRIFRQVRDFYESQELINIAVDGKHKRGDNTYTWLTGFNRGNFDGDPNRDMNLTFRSGFSDNFYQLGGAGDSFSPGIDTSLDRLDPANFRLTSADLGTRFTTDDEFVLRGDFQRDMELLGGEGFLKFGAQARLRDRDLRNVDRFYDSGTNNVSLNTGGTLNWNLANNFLGLPSAVANYNPATSVNGAYNYGFFIDPATARRVVNQLLADGTLAFSPAGQLDSDLRSLTGSYEAREEVYSTYGMAQTTRDKWTYMAGLRAELTRTNFKTASAIASGSLFTDSVAIDESNDYLDLLPGAHVRYDATKNLVFRGAITRSIARASYTQLNPSQRVDNAALTASGGDINLDPTRSTNLDFIVDYYIGRVGLVSFGAFYKDMKDNVYRLTTEELGANIPGANNPNALYTVTDFRNAKGADLYGFEFAFERDLSFLPGPLEGLGFFSNFTLTESEVDTGITNRAGLDTPLFGQVEKSYNVGLTYRKYGFSGRVAYNWTDAYLDFGGLNANPELDRYRDEIGTLDVRADYTFSKGITLFTEFRNVTNSPDRAFAGSDTLRPTYNEYKDWSAVIGLRWNL